MMLPCALGRYQGIIPSSGQAIVFEGMDDMRIRYVALPEGNGLPSEERG